MHKKIVQAFLAYLRKRYKESAENHLVAFRSGNQLLTNFWANRTHEYSSILMVLELIITNASHGLDVTKHLGDGGDLSLAIMEADNARLRDELEKLKFLEPQPCPCQKIA